jgi:predicted transcriptional regulator
MRRRTVATVREETKIVGFHLPKSLDREVERLAVERDVSKSAIATEALERVVRRARKRQAKEAN